MIDKIAIGKYFPGNSIIHKIDSRIKIIFSIVFFLLIFDAKNYISLLLMLVFTVFIAILSSIPLSKYAKTLKTVVLVSFFTAFINLFFDLETNFFSSMSFSLSSKSVKSSIFIFVRLLVLMITSSIIMFTTSVNDISNALESILSPLRYFKLNVQEIAMTVTISLRFIPIIAGEYEKILIAQRSKGADLDSRNPIKKVKFYYRIMIPLFISSLKKASDLALAMESRCYDSSKIRSKFKVMKLQSSDMLAIVFILLFFIGVILCNSVTIF